MDFGELFAKAMAAGEDNGQHGPVSLLATDDIDDALSEWGGEPEDASEDTVDAEAAPSGAPAGAPGDEGETRAEEDRQSTGQDTTKLDAYAAAFESLVARLPRFGEATLGDARAKGPIVAGPVVLEADEEGQVGRVVAMIGFEKGRGLLIDAPLVRIGTATYGAGAQLRQRGLGDVIEAGGAVGLHPLRLHATMVYGRGSLDRLRSPRLHLGDVVAVRTRRPKSGKGGEETTLETPDGTLSFRSRFLPGLCAWDGAIFSASVMLPRHPAEAFTPYLISVDF